MIHRILQRLLDLLFAGALLLLAMIILAALGTFTSRFVHSEDNRIKIAVIDTGVDNQQLEKYLCDSGHVDLTGEGFKDVIGHGNNIAAIITKDLNPKTHCIVVIKWYHNRSIHTKFVGAAIQKAIEANVSYINMSLEGYVADDEERSYLVEALNKGITVVVAAGNEGNDLGTVCDVYPACYTIIHRNFYIVANYINGHRYSTTNYGGPVNAFENGVNITAGNHTGTGTSQAAAVYTNKLLKGLAP